MSRSLTSEAIALNMTWPFVAVNNFEVFGRQTRLSSGMETVGMTAFVELEQLNDFNAFTQQNKGWIEHSHEIEAQIEDKENLHQPFDISPFVYDILVDPETGEQSPSLPSGDGPFAVIWGVSPPPISPYLLLANTFSLVVQPDPQVAIAKTQGMHAGTIRRKNRYQRANDSS